LLDIFNKLNYKIMGLFGNKFE